MRQAARQHPPPSYHDPPRNTRLSPVAGPVETHAANHPAGDKPLPDDKPPPDNKKAARSEAVPPEVKTDLDEATALLKKNDYDGALHIARRTLTVKPDLRGRKWVRFEVWDVAVNGAFTQPVWLE